MASAGSSKHEKGGESYLWYSGNNFLDTLEVIKKKKSNKKTCVFDALAVATHLKRYCFLRMPETHVRLCDCDWLLFRDWAGLGCKMMHQKNPQKTQRQLHGISTKDCHLVLIWFSLCERVEGGREANVKFFTSPVFLSDVGKWLSWMALPNSSLLGPLTSYKPRFNWRLWVLSLKNIMLQTDRHRKQIKVISYFKKQNKIMWSSIIQ